MLAFSWSPAFLAPSPLGCGWAEFDCPQCRASLSQCLRAVVETRFEEPLANEESLPSAHLSSQVAALLYNRVAAYTGQNQGFASNKADIRRFLMGRGSLTLVNGKSSLKDALRVYHMNLSNGDRSLLLHPSLRWQGDLTSGSYVFDSR